MTGHADWLALALMLGGGGGAGLLLLVFGWRALRTARAARHPRYERRVVHCPTHGQDVECNLAFQGPCGTIVNVARCPLHPESLNVGCGQGCLNAAQSEMHPGGSPVARKRLGGRVAHARHPM